MLAHTATWLGLLLTGCAAAPPPPLVTMHEVPGAHATRCADCIEAEVTSAGGEATRVRMRPEPAFSFGRGDFAAVAVESIPVEARAAPSWGVLLLVRPERQAELDREIQRAPNRRMLSVLRGRVQVVQPVSLWRAGLLVYLAADEIDARAVADSLDLPVHRAPNDL